MSNRCRIYNVVGQFANACVTRNSVVQEPVPDTKSLTVKIPVLLRVEMGYFTGMVVLGCIAHGVGLWLKMGVGLAA